MIAADEKTYEALLDAYSCALHGESVRWDEPIPAERLMGVVLLARQHSILPMLVQAAYDSGALKSTPDMRKRLMTEAERLTIRQAGRTAEFLLLCGELSARGIRPIVTKGIMCRVLYPHPDQRPSVDEDLFVSGEEYKRLHEVLLELGFKPVKQEIEPDEFEVSYTDDRRGLYIEVHKSFFAPDSDAYGDCNEPFEGAAERAVETDICGTPMRTLSPTDHLLYLILHAFKHFLHGGVGIRQAGDICMFAERYAGEIDFGHIAAVCGKLRIDRFAAALLKIGMEELRIGVPEIFPEAPDTKPLLLDMLTGGLYGAVDVNRQHSSNITLEAVASQKRGRRRRGAVSTVFLPRKALEGRYPYLKKCPLLLPAAWAQRIWGYVFGEKRVSPTESLRIGRERIALLKEYGIIEN